MLVLTRKEHQKIIIGDNEIVIKIIESKNGKVKVGIEADKKIKILREELY